MFKFHLSKLVHLPSLAHLKSVTICSYHYNISCAFSNIITTCQSWHEIACQVFKLILKN